MSATVSSSFIAMRANVSRISRAANLAEWLLAVGAITAHRGAKYAASIDAGNGGDQMPDANSRKALEDLLIPCDKVTAQLAKGDAVFH
jgi:hypothetical protein